LQVAREAISNAVRHAGAAIVVVSVRWSRRRFVLEVRDDGSGMPAAPTTAREGHGLRNMAARAAVLGGHLDVSSRPGQGTTVRLELPLASAVGGAR
jgi:signal transduction histidine kinase